MEPIGVKIVVIGGGTGSFTLLSGLKRYVHNITALVNMVDDGGSTGILRDELGVLPAGEVRQCLVALSNSPKVRDLFNYRFSEGSMKGHAFGNLFMAALEKMTGSFADAVDVASDVLSVCGRVEPMSLDDITLVATMNGKVIAKGQHAIDAASMPGGERPFLTLEPFAHINPRAEAAILRNIPAHTGKTTPGILTSHRLPEHPRAYGENGLQESIFGILDGTSPRIRGKQQRDGDPLRVTRNIPAHTGKTAALITFDEVT